MHLKIVMNEIKDAAPKRKESNSKAYSQSRKLRDKSLLAAVVLHSDSYKPYKLFHRRKKKNAFNRFMKIGDLFISCNTTERSNKYIQKKLNLHSMTSPYYQTRYQFNAHLQ